MNTIKLLEVQEQLQQDLLCRLDGLDSNILDDVCNIVIANLEPLKRETNIKL